MASKEKLTSLWDELNAVRCKQQYLNEAEMTLTEELLNGNIELNKDSVYGKAKLNMELESEFENILTRLEELF